MSKLKLFIFTIVILCFGMFLFYKYSYSTISPSPVVPILLSAKEKNNTQVSALKNVNNKNGCNVKKPLYSGDVIRNIDQNPDPKFMSLAYSDPRKIADLAEKDPSAAISLFKMVSSCFPELLREGSPPSKPRAGCPINNLDSTVHPLEILEAAAKSGSTEAQFAYAVNAPSIADYYSSLSTNEAATERVRILSNGLEFGTSAARAGVAEASLFMSDSYKFGIFGVRNNREAYAFLLPLTKSGNENYNQKIIYFKSILSKNEEREAQEIAFGCVQGDIENYISNPFKSIH